MLRGLIKEFREATSRENCLFALAMIIFCLFIASSPALELIGNTRLVRQEMRQMGHYYAAEIVTLERTRQVGVYIASVTVQNADGRSVEYWRILRWPPWSTIPRRIIAIPLYDHNYNLE